MMHALTDQVVALGIKRLRRAHVEHTYPPERSVSVRRLKSSPLKCASAKSCRAARPSRRGRPSGGIRRSSRASRGRLCPVRGSTSTATGPNSRS